MSVRKLSSVCDGKGIFVFASHRYLRPVQNFSRFQKIRSFWNLLFSLYECRFKLLMTLRGCVSGLIHLLASRLDFCKRKSAAESHGHKSGNFYIILWYNSHMLSYTNLWMLRADDVILAQLLNQPILHFPFSQYYIQLVRKKC